jgi:hypothetical protein
MQCHYTTPRLVPTRGIEPRSSALQADAMTSLAQSAKPGGDGGSRTPDCRVQTGRVPASTTSPHWGDRWDLNPRELEPQSSACPSRPRPHLERSSSSREVSVRVRGGVFLRRTRLDSIGPDLHQLEKRYGAGGENRTRSNLLTGQAPCHQGIASITWSWVSASNRLPLPYRGSTHPHVLTQQIWSSRSELNRGVPRYEGGAVPTEPRLHGARDGTRTRVKRVALFRTGRCTTLA